MQDVYEKPSVLYEFHQPTVCSAEQNGHEGTGCGYALLQECLLLPSIVMFSSKNQYFCDAQSVNVLVL